MNAGIQPIAWECECGGIVPVENIVCSECKRLRPYKCDCFALTGTVAHDPACPNAQGDA